MSATILLPVVIVARSFKISGRFLRILLYMGLVYHKLEFQSPTLSGLRAELVISSGGGDVPGHVGVAGVRFVTFERWLKNRTSRATERSCLGWNLEQRSCRIHIYGEKKTSPWRLGLGTILLPVRCGN